MDINESLFKGVSFSDLMQDVYKNSKTKDRQINSLIGELRPLIKSIGDATIIVPLIKEYMEVGVKNDEHIVKLAAIAQRMMISKQDNSNSLDFGDLFSPEEREQLTKELKSLNDSNIALSPELSKLEVPKARAEELVTTSANIEDNNV